MPYPWTAHDILTAADLNAAIATGIVSTGLGAWTPYTPSWTAATTNPVIGNGTIVGEYMKTGRKVDFKIRIGMGSTTTYGVGAYFWSLPVNANGNMIGAVMGWAACLDASASRRFVKFPLVASANTIQVQDADSSLGFVAPAYPMTWAVSDSFTVFGSFESAS
jgi:hypothetical protein